MLYEFLLYSKVSQSYIHIYPLFWGFPSHLGHYRALSRVSCVTQQLLISSLFYTLYQQCTYVSPNLPTHLTFYSLGVLTFVLYVCVSISALQISLSIPCFRIPHIRVNIQYLFFSFCHTSLCMTVSRSIHVSKNMKHFMNFHIIFAQRPH